MLFGSLFHSLGAIQEKALSPYDASFVFGSINSFLCLRLYRDGSLYSSNSDKYIGAMLFSALKQSKIILYCILERTSS